MAAKYQNRGTIHHMFGYLEGKAIADDLLLVGGVGYKVASAVPLVTGEEVSLWVHTSVSETSIKLYGVRTKQELELFEVLLGIRGIGGASALAALTTMSADALVLAIRGGDVAALKKIKGVGAKSAEAICREAAERLPKWTEDVEAATTNAAAEAANALAGLGYPDPVAAANAALSRLGDDAAAEAIVADALAQDARNAA